MNKENPTAEEILEKAINLTTPQERVAYIDGACGNDLELQKKIKSLLEVHERAGHFMPTDPGEITESLPSEPISEGPGKVISHYKLLQKIGEKEGWGLCIWLSKKSRSKERLP